MRYYPITAMSTESCRNKEIVVFFNGWGMDEKPFLSMGGVDSDLLIVSDYSSFDNSEELFAILDGYEKRSLIAWSMGVWAAQLLFGHLQSFFEYSIAVNGTLQPIHPQYGIDPQIFSNMSTHFSEQVRDSFYKQMCRKEVARFLENAPVRILENQGAELAYLYEHAQEPLATASLYDTALIASKDLIIPSSHQKKFWQEINPIILSASHFPFFMWQTMEECLHFCQHQSVPA